MFTANAWLRFRLAGVVVCILLIGFSATSYMSYRDAVNALKATILHQELPLTGSNIYSEIQADLIRPVFISSQMANDTFVKDWLLAGEKDPDQVVRYLDAIRQKYGVFTSFLIADQSKSYYHFSGSFRKIDAKNPDDVWFFRVKAMSAPYEINIDYDLQSNRTVTIFVNYRVVDYGGNFLGVTGVGLNIGSVQRIVERYRNDFQRNVYFVNKAGVVTVTTPRGPHSGDNINSMAGISAISSQILAKSEGQLEYQRGGETFLLDTRFIPELGWYVVVEQRQSEATRELRTSFVTNLWVGLGITLLTTVMVAYAVATSNRKLDVMAMTDKLTGLANRQAFDDALERLVSSRRRNSRPFSVLLFDIDDFKRINDTQGHLGGDSVIRKVAETAARVLRSTDLACRWGGDELIILAPNCALTDATRIAETLRVVVASEPIFTPDDGTRVTISIGVTEHQSGDTVDAILTRVDKALYRAKQDGRNCVRLADQPIDSEADRELAPTT